MDIMRTARVAVSSALYSIDRAYEYKIPDSLVKKLKPGMRVIVPFGRGNRKAEAFVLKIARHSGQEKLKVIDGILDDKPVLKESQIKLGLWMRDRFFCTAYDAMRAMLPAGIWFKIRLIYSFSKGITAEIARKEIASALTDKLIGILEDNGGSAGDELIKELMGTEEAAAAIKKLRDIDIIVQEALESKKIKDKTAQMVSLSVPAAEAMEAAVKKKRKAPMQASLLKLLSQIGEADLKELCYFTGATRVSVKKLEEQGYVEMRDYEVFRTPNISRRGNGEKPVLSDEQMGAFNGLMSLANGGKAAVGLLHGVTGSGKTSVYMAVIDEMLKHGKDSIFLVPEISLTPQLAGEFASRFGELVAVMHSGLSLGERYDEWKRVKNGDAKVVVGTRSAIFAPINNLGVIIIDEEHEYTYKSENSPRYHARDVAKYLCHQNEALLILGSATPDVESMYNADKGIYHYFTLKTRYNERELPEVIIADMKKNLREGNDSVISSELRHELSVNIENGQQSILFINRRGTSNQMACGECGYIHTCPRCSVSLTYHSDNNRLMCHYCGYSEKYSNECPECGGMMKHIGAGTQRVVAELAECFPDVKVLRMDTDTVTAKNSHEKILAEFERERVPILVGTQMITKGLDFENVTLVGVVSADQSLYSGSFRAQERTFSQITQVIGRAGRGSKKGRAVIQTYTPRNEVIELSASQDYIEFYKEEINLRHVVGIPPVCDIIYIMASGINESTVLTCMSYIRNGLEVYFKDRSDTVVLGPAPAAVSKINNRFRYRVTLKCKNDKMVRETVSHIIKLASKKKEYRTVSVFGDLGSMD